MPPPDVPKSDPLIVLLDEIELLSAQTRLTELYLKRAHTAGLAETEKIQDEFRANVASLKARLDDKGSWLSQHLAGVATDQATSASGESLLRGSEQQRLLRTGQNETVERAAEVAALQERLSALETAKQEWESSEVCHFEETHQESNSQIARLQEELARKERLLEQRDAAARQTELDAEDKIRTLAQELGDSREWAQEQQAEMLRGERDREELRQHVALLESSLAKTQSHARKELELVRQDAQAKITALQSEIAHKTNLLTRHQSTIANLEREIDITAETARSGAATQQALIDSHAAEIARRDAELASVTQRIAELQGAAQEQQRASADALAEARAGFAAEVAHLHNELAEKQQLLERGQGDLQQLEQDLRNRNRELQGQLAGKEAVVESLEHNVRQTQIELLAAREAVAHIQQTVAERQQQIAAKEHLLETCRSELDQNRNELTATLERLRQKSEEFSAMQTRTQDLAIQIDGLNGQLTEKNKIISRQDEGLRQTELRVRELSATLETMRVGLEHQQLEAKRKERDFAAQIAALQEELGHRQAIIREQEAAASRARPEINAQIHELECRLGEKERMLEARSLEIGMLQAQVESLSGQAARLEATYKQALEDSARENENIRQALQNEITALRAESERQSVLLEERQTARAAVEQKLGTALDDLRQQSAHWQAMLEKQTEEARHAGSEAVTLRARVAELERAAMSEGNTDRVAALEQQLQHRDQKIAELETSLQQSIQDSQTPASGPPLELAGDQSEQLKAAHHQINELLERLAQLETARQTLQENAGHELQQLRESFEARVGKLRAELAERDRAYVNDSVSGEPQAVAAEVEAGYQRQIQDLRSELEQKRSLLENRNEELIRVRAEMETLQGYMAHIKTNNDHEVTSGSFAVELREEDAIEVPHGLANGFSAAAISRPNPLQLNASEAAGAALHGDDSDIARTNRFTELEGRVRSWNPEPETDSALGSHRRWSAGLFKRRWRA
jgi:chromosome segregation ATPase